MNSIINEFPSNMQVLLAEIIGQNDQGLLAALRDAAEPDPDQRRAIEQILSDEFTCHLGGDYEPTERGKAIDNILGAFLLHWPIDTTRVTLLPLPGRGHQRPRRTCPDLR